MLNSKLLVFGGPFCCPYILFDLASLITMFLWFFRTISNLPEGMFGVANYLIYLIYGFDHRLIGPFFTMHPKRKACQTSLQSGLYALKDLTLLMTLKQIMLFKKVSLLFNT